VHTHRPATAAAAAAHVPTPLSIAAAPPAAAHHHMVGAEFPGPPTSGLLPGRAARARQSSTTYPWRPSCNPLYAPETWSTTFHNELAYSRPPCWLCDGHCVHGCRLQTPAVLFHLLPWLAPPVTPAAGHPVSHPACPLCLPLIPDLTPACVCLGALLPGLHNRDPANSSLLQLALQGPGLPPLACNKLPCR
jgi:hypothetical protein